MTCAYFALCQVADPTVERAVIRDALVNGMVRPPWRNPYILVSADGVIPIQCAKVW